MALDLVPPTLMLDSVGAGVARLSATNPRWGVPPYTFQYYRGVVSGFPCDDDHKVSNALTVPLGADIETINLITGTIFTGGIPDPGADVVAGTPWTTAEVLSYDNACTFDYAAALLISPRARRPIAIDPGGAATIQVHQGDNLQTIINNAVFGDIIELDAGASFGRISLPNKTGTGWIVIRSSGYASLPASGTRVSPSDVDNMAKLTVSDLGAVVGFPTLAHNYVLIGLEITETYSNLTRSGSMMVYGAEVTAEANQTHHIIFDRCYIHGNATGLTNAGVGQMGRNWAILNCDISDIKAIGAVNNECQAIMTISGAGPFRIVNNKLEATTETIMFGGGDPTWAGCIPSNIDFRYNLVTKRWPDWRWTGSGTHYAVKNLFELKCATKVLAEGNVIEYTWGADQQHAIVLTVRNQGGNNPTADVSDIQFHYNIIRHVGGFLNAHGRDADSQPQKRIQVVHNLLYDLDELTYYAGSLPANYPGTRIYETTTAGGEDWTLENNTLIGRDYHELIGGEDLWGVYALMYFSGTYPNIVNFSCRNNIMLYGKYGIGGDGTNSPLTTFNKFTVPYCFDNNVIIHDRYGGPSGYPPGQAGFPANMDAVGFVDWQNNDYRLAVSSPYYALGNSPAPLEESGLAAGEYYYRLAATDSAP